MSTNDIINIMCLVALSIIIFMMGYHTGQRKIVERLLKDLDQKKKIINLTGGINLKVKNSPTGDQNND